jgi:monofunctional biosynthetic peptidoglycan transglycosylase
MKTLKRLGWLGIRAVIGFYILIAVALVYLRFLPPLTTGIQSQRRIEALLTKEDYTKRSDFAPLSEISDNLEHAVIAAEDMQFYRHHGFDWEELRKAREEARRRGTSPRGASTISQQLVKNLFFTTHRSYVRKGLELTITPMAELILGKDRILRRKRLQRIIRLH